MSKTTKIILWVSVAVIVVGGSATAYYFLVYKKKVTPAAKPPIPTPGSPAATIKTVANPPAATN